MTAGDDILASIRAQMGPLTEIEASKDREAAGWSKYVTAVAAPIIADYPEAAILVYRVLIRVMGSILANGGTVGETCDAIDAAAVAVRDALAQRGRPADS